MAQKFNVVYKAAKETAYANAAASLVLAASLNSIYKFTPVLPSNGTAGTFSGETTPEYNIQRTKRIKGKDVATPHKGDTASALAALDGFSKVTWETIGVVTGEMRSVGLKLGINEKFEADSIGAVHAKAISDSVSIQLVERHEALLDAAIKGATPSGTLLAFSKGDTAVFDAIMAEVNSVMLLSDDFKHMTDKNNMVIIMHPTVADMVSKEIGTVFNQEAAIYKTGFRSGMSINGVPVIVDANLNKYDGGKDGATAANTIGAIVMDIEAMAFRAKEEEAPIDVNLGITRFFGKVFYNIIAKVDDSRVKLLEFVKAGSTAPTKTKKASA